MTEDHRAIFGAKLLQARRRAGLTQAQLAEAMGSTQAYISRAERGLENPPLLTCVAFAAAVGCSFVFAFDIASDIPAS